MAERAPAWQARSDYANAETDEAKAEVFMNLVYTCEDLFDDLSAYRRILRREMR